VTLSLFELSQRPGESLQAPFRDMYPLSDIWASECPGAEPRGRGGKRSSIKFRAERYFKDRNFI
jgi:hypothetical protein